MVQYSNVRCDWLRAVYANQLKPKVLTLRIHGDGNADISTMRTVTANHSFHLWDGEKGRPLGKHPECAHSNSKAPLSASALLVPFTDEQNGLRNCGRPELKHGLL